MASVPYSEGVPSVEPSVGVPDRYLRIPTTPAEFGGVGGQGLQAFGQGALKAHQFYAEVAADDATNQYMEGARKILYGDPDKPWLDASGNPIPDNDGNPQPDRGFFGLQGDQAMRAAPQKQKELEDLRKRLAGGLLTGDSALKFDAESRRMQSYHSTQIGAHSENEAQKWAGEVETARANNHKIAIGQAALANDPAEIARHEADLVGAYAARASRLGGGNDLLAQARTRGKTESIEAQIQAVAPTDPARAKQLLDDNRTAISGAGRYDALSNMVERLAHRDNVQKLTAIGMRSEGGEGERPGDPGANAQLAAQRSKFANELNGNPALKKRLAALVDLENPEAGTAVAESLMNRMTKSGGTIASGIGGGSESFYGPVRRGEVDQRLADIERDPARLAARMNQIDQALAGSNIVKGYTDQGSKGDPNYEAGGVGINIAGERFNYHGGDTPENRAWRVGHQIGAGASAPAIVGAGQLPQVSPVAAADSLAAGLARIRNAAGSFSEADRAAAEQHFETQWRANLADISRLEAIQTKQRQQVEATALDGYTQQIIKDPTQLDPQRVANDPSFAQNPHLRWQIMQMQHQALTQNQEKIADTSRAETVRLFDQMRRPGGDPQRMQDTGPMIDAMSAGKLRTSDFDWLMKSFADMRSPQGEKLATRRHEALGLLKNSITQSNELLGKRDAYGDAMLYMYDWTVDQKIEDYKKAGKDPADLFNPKNSDYVGSPDFIRPFQGSFQANIQRKTEDMLGRPTVPSYPDLTKQLEGETPEQWRHRLSMLGAAPPASSPPSIVPRLPGETLSDYAKRVGAAPSIPPAPGASPSSIVPPAPPIR